MNKVIALIIIATGLSACGFEIVDTGYRGVETTFGKVEGEPLPEGIYFYNPLTSDIVELNVKTQSYGGETSVYTKDVQQAKLTFVVNYNANPIKVHYLFQEVGKNWEEVILPQVINGSLKNVIGKWEAVELVSNRDKATVAIEESLRTALAPRGVIISKFEITNLDYADAFENAVEAKVVAIQRATEAENKTKQIEEEAKQKVISAQAEAESMRIRADALSQNKNLVEYEAVQKWDGKLPQYTLGGAIPFINIK